MIEFLNYQWNFLFYGLSFLAAFGWIAALIWTYLKERVKPQEPTTKVRKDKLSEAEVDIKILNTKIQLLEDLISVRESIASIYGILQDSDKNQTEISTFLQKELNFTPKEKSKIK